MNNTDNNRPSHALHNSVTSSLGQRLSCLLSQRKEALAFCYKDSIQQQESRRGGAQRQHKAQGQMWLLGYLDFTSTSTLDSELGIWTL